MGTLTDGTSPTVGRRPSHRRPASPRVAYVDPETLKERQSAAVRRHRQRRFYRDDPRAPLEPWPAAAAAPAPDEARP